MLDNSIDNLLSILNKTTKQCSDVSTLTETPDAKSTIMDRILGLSKSLVDKIDSFGSAYLSDIDIELINKVKNIPVTSSYRVMTYPNIHNEKKFDIRAGVLINYVLDKIDASLKDSAVDFDPYKINREAISYTLRVLIGRTPSPELSVAEFKEEYRLYAFGSNTKILMYPKVHIIIPLLKRAPYIINYIDTKLIYRHIRSLKEYANQVEDRFSKLTRSRPELSNQLNKYVECIEMAIKNVLKLYKAIRLVFEELIMEYRSILRQIIELNNDMTESINYDSITGFVNSSIKDFKSLKDVSVLNESLDTLDQNQKESLTKLESITKVQKIFSDKYFNHIGRMDDMYKAIVSNSCLISDINEPISKNKIFTILSVNKPINNNILNILTEYMNSRVNPLDSSSISDLLTNIFKDTEYMDCIYDGEDKNIIGKTLANISNKMIGNKDYINLNIEILANNLIKIPNMLTEIKNTVNLIYESVNNKLELMKAELSSNKNGVYNIKSDLDIILNYYLVYMTILLCIHENLYIIGSNTIESIRKLKMIQEGENK